MERLPYIAAFAVTAVLFLSGRKAAERLSVIAVSLWLCYEAVLGVMQLTGLAVSGHVIYPMTGSFQNPGPYGGFAAVCTAIALAAAYDWRNAAEKCDRLFARLAGVAGAWGIIVLPASMSRSAWGAFALAFGLWGLSEAKVRIFIKKHRRLALLAAAAAVIVAAGAFSLKRDSALGRFHIWEMELCAIADKPLTGHGSGYAMGSYADAQASYFSSKPRSTERVRIAGSPEYAFNEYFRVGMEYGVLAMSAFAALSMCGFIILRRTRSALAWGLAVWGTFAFASYPLSVWQLCLLLAVMLGAACGYLPTAACKRLRIILVSAAVIISVASISVWLPYASRKRGAEEKWREVQMLASFGADEGIADRLASLYPVLRRNYRFLYDYGYSLHKSGRYGESSDILLEGAARSSDPMFHNIIGKNFEAMGDYVSAETCWLHSHYMVPSRLYPYILLMEMYDRLGEKRQAADYARKVLEKPVNERNTAMAGLRERAEKYLRENEKDY